MSLIFSGCILQPTSQIVRQFNFVDYDAPAVRLAKPITTELLQKQSDGSWVSIGVGEIPAGAYIKGRKPKADISK
jgi:hypothetical protein